MELPKRLQCSLTNVMNMGRIQTYASVLSTEELTTHLKQDREKWRAMFHTCIKLFTPTPVYVCIYYISGRKWSTTHIAQISQEKDRHNVYAIKKTMWPPCYHINGFVATYALGTWWTKFKVEWVCVVVKPVFKICFSGSYVNFLLISGLVWRGLCFVHDVWD